jgi:hypothetical protein
MTTCCKRFATDPAWIGFYSSMRSHVRGQTAICSKLFATVLAIKWSFSCMDTHMCLK